MTNRRRGDIMIIRCDRCRKKFTPKVKLENIGNDVHEIFFICPVCKKRYHVSYENKITLSLKERIKRVSKSQVENINKNNDLEKITRISENREKILNNLRNALNKEIERLEKKVRGK